MVRRPATRYAVVDGCHLGYQVVGSGPVDVVLLHQWFTNVDALWDVPPIASLVEDLAEQGRVLLFDKRGTGVSDMGPSPEDGSLEPFRSDLAVLLDVVGFNRATLIAGDSASMLALDFAAHHPDRVGGLVVIDGFAHRSGDSEGRVRSHIEFVRRLFIDGEGLDLLAPTCWDDPRQRDVLTRYLRLSASPGVAAETRRWLLEVDVRPVLAKVSVPTLVVHRTGNGFVSVEHGREVAAAVPGARLLELAGSDGTMYSGNREEIATAIAEFLGSTRTSTATRRLQTVVFTDIVDSTDHATSLGDKAWVDVLHEFRTGARRLLARHAGREVNTRGDDLLVTFSDPLSAVTYAVQLRGVATSLDLRVRSGLHFGGTEDMEEDDIGGIAVHIGARVASMADAGEVLVSRTVADLLAGSPVSLTDRGYHELKGVNGSWQIFTAEL